MTSFYKDKNIELYHGPALQVLKTLPDNHIDCVMTSPPYWGLRDYGVPGQLGLEPTFGAYINDLCSIFDEIKRIMKESGTCWVNLGDTYSSSTGAKNEGFNERWHGKQYLTNKQGNTDRERPKRPKNNLPSKCLCQIPSRFAIEMSVRGWILRNEIIWYKPNCMPSSASDRFTVDFEKLFFFVKNKKYYFDQQFEKYAESTLNGNPTRDRKVGSAFVDSTPGRSKQSGGKNVMPNKKGRNKRTVWKISPVPFPESHFAVYPEELCETPIKAGCPKYICKKCEKIREKIFDKEVTFHSGSGKSGNKPGGKWSGKEQQESGDYDIRMGPQVVNKFIGYTDCGCNAGFRPGIVLDIFHGSGTTGKVAQKLGRRYIGIDINKEYLEMSIKTRLKDRYLDL